MSFKNKLLSIMPMTKRRTLKELKRQSMLIESSEKRLMDRIDRIESSIAKLIQDREEVAESNLLFIQDELIKLGDGNKTISERLSSTEKSTVSQLNSIESSINSHNDSINRYASGLSAQLENIKLTLPNKVSWKNSFERTIVSANWGDVLSNPDFSEKYRALVSGMDSKSVGEIIKILSRQHKYLTSNANELDLFTSEEQRLLRKLDEQFTRQIIRLSDEIYAYNNYLLPINHFEPSVFYYKHGIEQLTNPASIRNRDIIDVGGFIGDSILVLNELHPCTITSFEGDPKNFALMKKTLELNKIENAIIHNVALGDMDGVTAFHQLGSMSSSVSRKSVDYEAEFEVSELTLDTYEANHELDIALIKVDIEGAEPHFLEGAKKTIEKHRPILLVSIYHNAHDFFELKPLIESWNLDYSFSIHKPVYGNITSETLLICEPL